jgi:diguanylate cyclase (GGDEF)-like protein
MKRPKKTSAPRRSGQTFSYFQPLVICFSLVGMGLTFILASSSAEMAAKARGFFALIGGFVITSICLYVWQVRKERQRRRSGNVTESEIEAELLVLDEASDLFSGALNPSDAFRLISSRVNGLLPFRSIALFVPDGPTRIKVAESSGPDAIQKGLKVASDEGLAGQCFASKAIEIEQGADIAPSVAIPLWHDSKVFGVLQLSFDKNHDARNVDQSLFEAIGTRAAPLVLSSMAFERSHNNALTDVTTDLPNERAFDLILGNQVAEVQRRGSTRTLSILAIDIKEFEALNKRFGHATGDRILNFTGQLIKDHLRDMDFCARGKGDEFLAVLPTATEELAREIVERIQTGFFGRKIRVSERDDAEVQLNFGWAAFGLDGETPAELLNVARTRRSQSVPDAPAKVVWLRQEMVN